MNLTSDAVFARLRKLLAEQLGLNEYEVALTSTGEDLGADSLDEIEVIMAVEDEFELEIPDEDTDALKTVQDLHSYLLKRLDVEQPVQGGMREVRREHIFFIVGGPENPPEPTLKPAPPATRPEVKRGWYFKKVPKPVKSSKGKRK